MDSQFSHLVNRLNEVLDKDIEHTRTTLDMLDELRGKVIKRDEKGMQQLLEKVRISNTAYSCVENQRQQIRGKLARICNCSVQDMTVTRLCEVLPEEQSRRLNQTKLKLTELLSKLKAEQLSTSMLLNECRRFNDVMLGAMLKGRRNEVTYSPKGSKKLQSNINVMNLQL